MTAGGSTADITGDATARPRVILGVGGGIAAYKACETLRRLSEGGADVTVVPTASALRFVGSATWEALSGHPVHTEVWDDVEDVPHVALGRAADLVVIAPATADLMARAAHGRADDLLTSILLTVQAPVLYAPAMHTEMWQHPATAENVATLRRRGAIIIEPDVGRLTGADSGPGRLPDPGRIASMAQDVLLATTRGSGSDLQGVRLVVSAGGTREEIDPVRWIGNRSSGRQGYALARAAKARGADVTLVSANATLPDPIGVHIVRVTTAESLRLAVREGARDADAVVMAAAVADFRPANRAETKIKKSDEHSVPTVVLEQTTDVLAELVAVRDGQRLPVIVGFGAETGTDPEHTIELGRQKLRRKGCDLLVVNDVGAGKAFDADVNEAVILDREGGAIPVPFGPKAVLAHAVLDQVAHRLRQSGHFTQSTRS